MSRKEIKPIVGGNKVDEIGKAWAAGFFDGEGSISISRNSFISLERCSFVPTVAGLCFGARVSKRMHMRRI